MRPPEFPGGAPAALPEGVLNPALQEGALNPALQEGALNPAPQEGAFTSTLQDWVRTPALPELLGVRPGVTAIIGGGGKTTLLYTLARVLSARGRVLVTSSAKIRRPDTLPVLDPPTEAALREALDKASPLCLGSPRPGDKLGAPTLPFGVLARLADYVLTEADGSRGLPAKAHAPHEPPIPPEAGTVILVLGADAFGQPIERVCHRPERFAALAGVGTEALLSPAEAAAVIAAEGYGNMIYVNKCEAERDWQNAAALAALLDVPLAAGSLRSGLYRNMGFSAPQAP